MRSELMFISNLDELYRFAAEFVDELHNSGQEELADSLYRACGGGSTSGEILDGIGVVLLDIQSKGLGDERVGDALRFIASVVGPPRAQQD